MSRSFYCLSAMLIWHTVVYGQTINSDKRNHIGLEYNNVHAGSNVSVTYHHDLNHGWSIYGGIKYIIIVPVRQASTHATPFFKNMYPNTLAQYLGPKLGVEKSFSLGKANNTSLYTFADFQLTRSLVHFLRIKTDSLYPQYQYVEDVWHGPATLYELYIGIGVKTHILPRLSIKFFAGAGPVFFSTTKYDATHNTYVDHSTQAAFGRMYGLGVEYGIGK